MKKLLSTPRGVVLVSVAVLVFFVALAWVMTVRAAYYYVLVDEFSSDTISRYDVGAESAPSACLSGSPNAVFSDIANRRTGEEPTFTDGEYLLEDGGASDSASWLYVGVDLSASMDVDSFGLTGRPVDSTSQLRMGWLLCDDQGDWIASDTHTVSSNEWYVYPSELTAYEDVDYVVFAVQSDDTDGVELGSIFISGLADSDPMTAYPEEETLYYEPWASDVISSYDWAPEIPATCYENSAAWVDYDEWTLKSTPTWYSEGFAYSAESGTSSWQVTGVDLGSAHDIYSVGFHGRDGSGTDTLIKARLLLCTAEGLNVSVSDPTYIEDDPYSITALPWHGWYADVRYVYLAWQMDATAKNYQFHVIGELSAEPTATPTPTSIFQTTPTPPETTPTPYIPNTPYPTATWPPGWPTPDPEATPGGDAPQFVVPIMPTNPPPTATPDVPDYDAPSPSQVGSGLSFGQTDNGMASVALVPYDLGCPIQIPDTELGPGTTICISYIYVKDTQLLGMEVPMGAAMTGVLVLFVVGWIIRR